MPDLSHSKMLDKPLNVFQPIDRIITETDSPYLTPVPYRGKENEPMYVEYVAKKICEIKQLDEASACRQFEENFNSIFD